MSRILFLVFVVVCCFGPISAQRMLDVEKDWQIPVYDYDGLAPVLHVQNDTTYIVNFWATWCAPCVKELPYFEELQLTRVDKKLQVILVSLDFPKHFESKLIPFLQKHQLQSRVVVLDDTNANRWIDAISPEWTGALPATLVFKGDRRDFHERTFNSTDELNAILKPFFNL